MFIMMVKNKKLLLNRNSLPVLIYIFHKSDANSAFGIFVASLQGFLPGELYCVLSFHALND